jgi:hypothetical protein
MCHAVCRASAPAGSAVAPGFAVKEDAKPLFEPVKLGALQLQHRVVMAPLTRCRWARVTGRGHR